METPYNPISKSLIPSIEKLHQISSSHTYKVSIVDSEDHQLHGCIFETIKGNRQFDFESSTKMRKGVQNPNDLQIDRNKNVTLETSAGEYLYTSGQYVLVNDIDYDWDNGTKTIGGILTRFSTTEQLPENLFFRLIIPINGKAAFNINHFQRHHFIEKKSSKKIPYIKLDVDGSEMHLYNYSHSKEQYLVIDSLSRQSIIQFQKKSFCILLILGLIKGDFIHDECFIFSYKSDQLTLPQDVFYNSMRASIHTQQPLFTTSYYSIFQDVDYKRDENGEVSKEDPLYNRLKGDISYFPDSAFSNLATLCYVSEKVQRAILIFIDSHLAMLETKIPNYYVALEAIAGHIYEERREKMEKISVAPIRDKGIAKQLINDLKDLITNTKANSTVNDDDFSIDILFKNIERLNSPPNADKLKEAFTYVNYQLSDEQIDLLMNRNRFLHGSFFKIIGDEELFRQAFHAALKLETMLAILILRLGGFSGSIINYAGLWSNITELGQDEDRILDI